MAQVLFIQIATRVKFGIHGESESCPLKYTMPELDIHGKFDSPNTPYWQFEIHGKYNSAM